MTLLNLSKLCKTATTSYDIVQTAWCKREGAIFRRQVIWTFRLWPTFFLREVLLKHENAFSCPRSTRWLARRTGLCHRGPHKANLRLWLLNLNSLKNIGTSSFPPVLNWHHRLYSLDAHKQWPVPIYEFLSYHILVRVCMPVCASRYASISICIRKSTLFKHISGQAYIAIHYVTLHLHLHLHSTSTSTFTLHYILLHTTTYHHIPLRAFLTTTHHYIHYNY
jgi:hypothetical protein